MERETVPNSAPAAAPGLDPAASSPTGLEAALARLEDRLDRLLGAAPPQAGPPRPDNARQARVEQFAASHPDFRELRESGVLAAIRDENPLLDDLGAYLAHRLASERRQAATTLETARREAAAQAEADTLERIRAKRQAATLSTSQGGPGRGQGQDPELGAPERFGGLTAVLASRLEARRKAVGH